MERQFFKFNKKTALILGFVVIILSFTVFYLLTAKGYLIVVGAGDNQISLSKVVDNGIEENIDSAKGDTKFTLSPGKYIVQINNKSQSFSKSVDIKRSETVTVEVELPDSLISSFVANENMRDFVVRDNEVVGIENGTNRIKSVSGIGDIKFIDNSINANSIKWSNKQLGVIQARDGSLSVIKGNTLKPLNLPALNDAGFVVYEVDSRGRVVVFVDGVVYLGDLDDGKLNKIYEHNNKSVTLAIQKDRIAIINASPEEKVRGDDNMGGVIIDTDGDFQSSIPFGSTHGVSWSDDATLLAVSNNGENFIFDTTLSETRPIGHNGPIAKFVWNNNSSVVFAAESNIWSHQLSSRSTTLVTSIPNSEEVKYLNLLNDIIYIGSSDAEGDGFIYKVVESVESYKNKILLYFPRDFGECFVSLYDISSLTIVIETFIDTKKCNDYVETSLSRIGSERNKIRVVTN